MPNSCNESVQNSLVNTASDFFTLSEFDLLKTLKQIVTKQSNPAIHRLNFSSLRQSETESIKEFLIRLKSTSPDCEFTCPSCDFDLQPIHVKDQLIRGLENENLQTDILAKASQLKTLEDVIRHAEAFETAQRDQSHL